MSTCSLRRARIFLLTLTLGIVFASLVLAERAPVCAEPQSGKACAPRMSVAASQPVLNLSVTPPGPVGPVCYWAIYEEYWKDGEICRYGDSCSGDWYGYCTNGYDWRHREIFTCCP